MSLCNCPDHIRPRCMYILHCGRAAEWSIFTPPSRWIKEFPHGRHHFMCTPCKEYYLDAVSRPLKGIDKPEGSDGDWRPSLMDHLRHGEIALAFAGRGRPGISDAQYDSSAERYWHSYERYREFTPAQVDGFRTFRLLTRKYQSGKVTA